MITLEAADLIEGDASAANVVDYTINGAEVDSSRNVDVKALADGQLAVSKGTLYTTPASTTTIVKAITLVNTDSSARTVNLYVQRDGSNSRRIIPENLSLEADGGCAVLSDQLRVFSASGALKQTLDVHAATHLTGGSDEVDGDKLDIDWNPSHYTPATTPSEADNADNLTAHLYGIDQELGQKLENVVEDTTPQLGGPLDCQNQPLNSVLGLLMKSATELTIATGAVTATQMFHTIDTEGDAATDDLDTINGGATVNMIVIRAANDARTVVVKHNTGNIWLQGKADINLDDLEDGLLLIWDGTKWFDIAAGGGGGGSATKLQDADSDTKVDVEESADEDTVRMDVAGIEAFNLSSVGILTLAKQSGCHAYKSAAQSVPNVTETKIQLEAENYDIQNEYDTTNHKFTVGVAGVYLIIIRMAVIDLGNGKFMAVRIYKNGASLISSPLWYNTTGATTSITNMVSGITQLAVNDYIECYMYHDHGSARNTGTGLNYDFMLIQKLA